MYGKKPLLSFFILPFLIASCSNENRNYTAYFSGQVKNPRLPYVLFSRNNKVLDTLKLDKENRFAVKFDSLTPGMYSFKHDPDYQYVYFEKNDSISVFINADDFDRSIAFSGRGEQKNNFLMELFTMNDNDRRNSYDIFSENYKAFSEHIDTDFAEKKSFYERRKKDLQWSNDFDFYAKYRLNLNYYSYKEYYPYIHARRTGQDIRPQIPNGFYDFRKKIDFNDKRLNGFSPFTRYSMAFISNMAYFKTFKNTELKEDAVTYNINKLKVADSIFKDENLKNSILNSIAFAYLLEYQNIDNNRVFLKVYASLSTDKSPDNEINKMTAAITQLLPNEKLPGVNLVDTNNRNYNLSDGLGKKTVVFFWTGCARVNLQQVYAKVSDLQKDYPNTAFIAVNVDNDKEWRKNLINYSQKGVTQLRATDFQSLRQKWALTKINRTIVLKPDGTIDNAFTNLLDSNFFKLL